MLCALARMGGRVTLSADAHDVRAVATHFEQAEALIRACGFREIWQLELQRGKACLCPGAWDEGGFLGRIGGEANGFCRI